MSCKNILQLESVLQWMLGIMQDFKWAVTCLMQLCNPVFVTPPQPHFLNAYQAAIQGLQDPDDVGTESGRNQYRALFTTCVMPQGQGWTKSHPRCSCMWRKQQQISWVCKQVYCDALQLIKTHCTMLSRSATNLACLLKGCPCSSAYTTLEFCLNPEQHQTRVYDQGGQHQVLISIAILAGCCEIRLQMWQGLSCNNKTILVEAIEWKLRCGAQRLQK